MRYIDNLKDLKSVSGGNAQAIIATATVVMAVNNLLDSEARREEEKQRQKEREEDREREIKRDEQRERDRADQLAFGSRK